ncbi:3-methyl-2-oxobutanoate hydroxymethyltransferase [Sphingobium sp. WW5]|uniref:3-methyl-2-oxobutanoate hydroxymethyltransferase n=1 Tax=Sphingobium yanoikuyae TaxID=13690 RepID=A0A084EFX7_SPHYA|nr:MULTISPECIES: 3-methyl-2-oxobutanoate hydroxymethyltransferase [Sphingobium]KEZ16869.1 3-methyl-2-oxobutanoate hydroxymethyltransferase [Sphingobium yanoikuyae]KZC75060.1 3-methyl-2-oxobutanoate hydroxymethyltransferase [Sphingobium yanoikuyae]TKV41066.1 3-methyl-2-oxobutanoate hydroxymethyltransferase [Sphingobium sp. MP9-4]
MSKQARLTRTTPPSLLRRKGGDKIVCLTAYTAPMAQLLDSYCDILLVGDSLGMVVHGLPTTVGVTLEMMILHGRAVVRGSSQAMVAVDLPFGSYERSPEQAFDAASRLLAETGAQAVKVEAAQGVAESIAFLTGRGIPVIGHVGLRPQAVHLDGGFKARGRTDVERDRVLAEARATDEAGAMAMVVEGVTPELAADITAAVACPTIGIGASNACDGQILVTEDMLGLFDWTPKFVRRYADLRGTITAAIAAYASDVKAGTFPAEAEEYRLGARA